MKNDRETMSVQIPLELYKKIEALAEEEMRETSRQIEYMLTYCYERRPYQNQILSSAFTNSSCCK